LKKEKKKEEALITNLANIFFPCQFEFSRHFFYVSPSTAASAATSSLHCCRAGSPGLPACLLSRHFIVCAQVVQLFFFSLNKNGRREEKKKKITTLECEATQVIA